MKIQKNYNLKKLKLKSVGKWNFMKSPKKDFFFFKLIFFGNLPGYLIFLHLGSVVIDVARDFKALPKV